MSDRLTDAELASLRQHLREERERNHRVPTLTWAEVDALLDEVREARSIARDSDVRQLLDSDGAINVTAVSWWSREAPQLPLGTVSRCIAKLETERNDFRARHARGAGQLLKADIDLSEARERIDKLEAELARLKDKVARSGEATRVITRKIIEQRHAREAQLAEMRRELMEDEEAGGAYYSSIEPILDRHAIPTTPPEAEEDDQ